jgi:hypothetical protein
MGKTVVLDTNLLVLLVVGLTNRKYISAHGRLRAYTVDDFDLLSELIGLSAGVVVTPNTLTEASDLLRQKIREPAKSEIAGVFQVLIQKLHERYVSSIAASTREEFLRIGLADSVLLEIGKEDVVILSADLDLCVAAEMAGYTAINFNHERDRPLD